VAAVEAACRTLGGERQTDPSVAGDWALCRDQQLPWFRQQGDTDLWRLSVAQTAPVLDLPEAPLIEWHGGQRWVRARAGDAAWLRSAAEAAGGHATLFRPAGTGARHRFHPLTPPLDHIHHELKRQFDPANIFNRGRLYAEF
jgi:glycolate oxidase FAD binding subunit